MKIILRNVLDEEHFKEVKAMADSLYETEVFQPFNGRALTYEPENTDSSISLSSWPGDNENVLDLFDQCKLKKIIRNQIEQQLSYTIGGSHVITWLNKIEPGQRLEQAITDDMQNGYARKNNEVSVGFIFNFNTTNYPGLWFGHVGSQAQIEDAVYIPHEEENMLVIFSSDMIWGIDINTHPDDRKSLAGYIHFPKAVS